MPSFSPGRQPARSVPSNFVQYLATLIEALERQGHLHLIDTYRSQLLPVSAVTADRLLRRHRTHDQHGLATTRIGTLLKQQTSGCLQDDGVARLFATVLPEIL